MLTVVVVVALVVAAATYLTWVAGRLDRLAVRVESAWETLDAQLSQRALAAHDLAQQLGSSGFGAELDAVAGAAGGATAEQREVAENRLSRALHAVPLTEAVRGGTDLSSAALDVVADLERSSVRVALARHVYNDAVRDLLVLRHRRLVRLLHLYGRAVAPAYFEFDSTVPERGAAPSLVD